MEKNFVGSILVGIVLFLGLGIFMGYKIGVNKYDNYYYYYINQYPAMETINKIQDMSTEK